MAREETGVAVASPAGGKAHLAYVDGMRALAALYVVLNHAWLQSWPVAGPTHLNLPWDQDR